MRRLAAVVLTWLLGACAGAGAVSEPWRGTAGGWTPIAAEIRPIGLGAPGGVRLAPGVRFAGGLQIVAPRGDRLHGLSDLKLVDGDFIAVTDAGDLVRGRLGFDRRGRLAGLSGLRLRGLTAEDGRGFPSKADGDAESLAITADGDLLVGFEQRPRLWSYGPLDGLRDRPSPRAVPPVPPGNDGLEALAAGPDGLRAAAEGGGVWDCAPLRCVEVVAPPATPPAIADWRITGMDRDPAGGGWFVVERLYRAPFDMRARLRRMDASGRPGPVLATLGLPSTTDNFEGVAATAGVSGTRLYILSDDNDNPRQRTLLLAFDVEPAVTP
ncbi:MULTISPECIES: esterase-like activity of phytase family protein [unclassified Brevundimonas]|uniref:esterase-like activity of phytase family protein n=1 Tax=unclassified Brevundimonas TaxID=2622653 RepID=UPI0006FC5BEF|nr:MULTISPECIES: esterase-like activity of phytase family protein [unclassified Brevundimonas]KQY90880.1 Tat pathway signal protein [Brevundimonas sp. Root1423]KRA28409.1 Tat pathway signal protein [Brevundimonas sp. Root608]